VEFASSPGWLWCNGAGYVRVDYAELFAAIGLTYSDIVGSGGNKILNTSYFKVPDLAGRIPIGSGTGKQTGLDANSTGDNHGPAELDTETLTPRVLGDYGATEAHTLTAGESGSGPHYHAVDPQAHTHGIRKWSDYDAAGLPGQTQILKSYTFAEAREDSQSNTESTTSTIKASHELNVAGTTETVAQGGATDAAFRTDKTDLNAGVPAASSHTQMQPFIVINYIIKY